jgi:hypothetical protein
LPPGRAVPGRASGTPLTDGYRSIFKSNFGCQV